MLDFLNQTIGVDTATYIGLGLAIVGFFLGKKVSNKTLNQNIKKGNGVQTTGDVRLEISHNKRIKSNVEGQARSNS